MKRKDFFLIVIAAVVMAVVMKCFNQNADDVPSDFPELEKRRILRMPDSRQYCRLPTIILLRKNRPVT